MNKSKREGRMTKSERIAAHNKAFENLGKTFGKDPTPFLQQVPTAKKRVKDKTKTYEADVLKAILRYVRYHPKVWWVMRVNSGTFVDGDRFIAANSQRGMSDVIGMFKGGRMFVIEVKRPGGRATKEQLEYIEHINRGEGLGFVADSVDVVADFFSTV